MCDGRSVFGDVVSHLVPGSVDHLVDVVEHHEISRMLPPNASAYERQTAISSARADALRWAETAGQEPPQLSIVEHNDPPTAGVAWEVVVLTGAAAPSGSRFRWRWTHRWRQWLHSFNMLQAVAHPGADNVVDLQRPEVDGPAV